MSTVEYEPVEMVAAGEPVLPLPGEPVAPAGSLQAKVQAGRARAQHSATVDIEIPGYDGTLWGTFRAVDDFKERHRIEKRWEKVRSEAQRALDVAVEMLRVACLDVFVPTEVFVPGETKEGDRVSLEMSLGVELAKWLGVFPPNGAGVVNDHEILLPIGRDEDGKPQHGIFPSTVAIFGTAGELHRFSVGAGERADEEAQGNS